MYQNMPTSKGFFTSVIEIDQAVEVWPRFKTKEIEFETFEEEI